MNKVTLKTAYWWHCESCGEENFARGVKAELPPGEKEELYRRFHGLEFFAELPDDWQDFELVSIPDAVTCRRCGETFETEDERDQEGE